MTVIVLPATVIVVDLEVVLVLGAAEPATVPLPVPLFPDVIVNHDALLLAVQEHPVCVVTVAAPVAPDAGNDALVGETE